MPLIECSDCHVRISDSAVSCPHCGYSADRIPSILRTSHQRMIDLINTENSIFSIQSPLILTQVIPSGPMLNSTYLPDLLNKCNKLNTLIVNESHFFPRRINSGVLAYNVPDICPPNVSDFIYISNEGEMHLATNYPFNTENSQFLLGAYMKILCSHLSNIINLYTDSLILGQFWLIISLLNIKNYKLFTNLSTFHVNECIAIEQNAALTPIQFTCDNVLDIQNEEFYFNVADSVLHVFGKESYPRNSRNKFFSDR